MNGSARTLLPFARAGAWAALCALLACGGGRAPVHAVSLSPGITKVVAALGLSGSVTQIDPRAPDALTLALNSGAQFALADSDAEATDVRAVFASRSVAVHVFAPQSSDEVFGAYRALGALLGDPDAGDDLAEKVGDELDQLAAATPESARPKVALVLQRNPLRVVTGDGFLTRVLAAAGAQNAFGDLSAASVAIRPELLSDRAPRQLDVPPELAAGAWIDPSGTAQRLREMLADAAR